MLRCAVATNAGLRVELICRHTEDNSLESTARQLRSRPNARFHVRRMQNWLNLAPIEDAHYNTLRPLINAREKLQPSSACIGSWNYSEKNDLLKRSRSQTVLHCENRELKKKWSHSKYENIGLCPAGLFRMVTNFNYWAYISTTTVTSGTSAAYY